MDPDWTDHESQYAEIKKEILGESSDDDSDSDDDDDDSDDSDDGDDDGGVEDKNGMYVLFCVLCVGRVVGESMYVESEKEIVVVMVMMMMMMMMMVMMMVMVIMRILMIVYNVFLCVCVFRCKSAFVRCVCAFSVSTLLYVVTHFSTRNRTIHAHIYTQQ